MNDGSTQPLTIAAIAIQQDAAGRFCLNDLHKAAGGESRCRPAYWLESQQTKELIAELTDAGNPASEPIQTLKGGNGLQGTYVCRELVYAYAMWISPRFHLQVIRAFDALVSAPVGDLSEARVRQIAGEVAGQVVSELLPQILRAELRAALPQQSASAAPLPPTLPCDRQRFPYALPAELLLEQLPSLADREDSRYWYVLTWTMRRLVRADPIANVRDTALWLKDLGILLAGEDGRLTCIAPPLMFRRPQWVYVLRKDALKAGGR